jgi:hypothetical protein
MSKEQWMKIAKGAAISVGAALLSYVEMTVIPGLSELHPQWAVVLTSINSIAIQSARKYLESLMSGAK